MHSDQLKYSSPIVSSNAYQPEPNRSADKSTRDVADFLDLDAENIDVVANVNIYHNIDINNIN